MDTPLDIGDNLMKKEMNIKRGIDFCFCIKASTKPQSYQLIVNSINQLCKQFPPFYLQPKCFFKIEAPFRTVEFKDKSNIVNYEASIIVVQAEETLSKPIKRFNSKI